MKVGFTGSRKGMAVDQESSIRRLMEAKLGSGLTEVHHGDCTGADEDFHGICIDLKVPYIGIHPGYDYKGEFPTRSYCDQHSPGEGATRIEVFPPAAYLVRDQVIVESTESLIAAPKGFKEELRSGTWTTIRKARKLHPYNICIVYPDGTISFE